MMIDKITEIRIKLLSDRIGNFIIFTSEYALECAAESERIARQCGPFDPVYSHYIGRSEDWLKAAVILEGMGK